MYNRYIPGSNGVYQRHTVPDSPVCMTQTTETEPTPLPCITEAERPQQQPCSHQTGLLGLDWGDLLLLCIVLLLLLDSDEDDMLPILIMAAAFLLLQ